ncbi:MAG: hypothetical protein KatS3mg114_1339 [Planctomycetaceae bacterium]|nr:MAG: hypothetical protein KatS3mg114_1339 [Planctomycetaceae bacterium]
MRSTQGSLFMILSLSWLGTVCGAEHTKEPLDKVRQQVESGQAVLIDVREKSEWEAGHLRDAQLLPLSQLRQGLPAEELRRRLPKDKPIYLHCQAGVRCLKAAEILEKAGIATRPLSAGYPELLRAGFAPAQ